MKNPDLFASVSEECKKLAKEAKRLKRLKERKEFMKRLQEDLSRR